MSRKRDPDKRRDSGGNSEGVSADTCAFAAVNMKRPASAHFRTSARRVLGADATRRSVFLRRRRNRPGRKDKTAAPAASPWAPIHPQRRHATVPLVRLNAAANRPLGVTSADGGCWDSALKPPQGSRAQFRGSPRRAVRRPFPPSLLRKGGSCVPSSSGGG